MEARLHKDYEEETAKLQDTKDWLCEQQEKLKLKDAQLEKDIAALKKTVRSALDERLVLQQQLQQTVKEDISKFEQVSQAPYFGRIDFLEDGAREKEVEYIGKFGLYDSLTGKLLVLDWRTPMANIYYSGIDEDVSYRAPDQMIEGKMLLKRRYVIEEGNLTEIHDEKSLQDNLYDSITQNSDFLIDSLNKSTSGRLKEIVATIQKEQNQIIRSESFMPLIVQGVAGSGKTTIALHRMAYLIYNAQNPSARYMVVAPNKLFLNYISDILPDLGVNNVTQTTFETWALSQLGKGIKLKEAKDKLDTLLVETEETARILALASKFRGSIVFQKIIDLAFRKLEQSILPAGGIRYEDSVIISEQEIQKIFLVSNSGVPLKERVRLLGEYIKKRLKDNEAGIKGILESSYAEKIKKLKASVPNVEMVRKDIIKLFDERDDKIKQIKKWIPTYVKEYLKQIVLPTSQAFYKQILEDKEQLAKWLAKQITREDLEQIIPLILDGLDNKKVETEDLGPLLYIQHKLYGLSEEKQYAHIVVDEAQDLDEMKLTVLRQLSSNDVFTLVGDLAQGIYGYKGIQNWQRTMQRVFGDKKYNYFEMTTSYRSTIEIIALANKVISQCQDFEPLLAQPVLRHGDEPELIKCKDEAEKMEKIYARIKQDQEAGLVSICIITKDAEEGKKVYELLKKKGLKLQWISQEEEAYEGGLVVMPSYLAKGLEFDSVILYDVSKNRFKGNPLDIKLLYVMITRALHRVSMYSVGEATELLS